MRLGWSVEEKGVRITCGVSRAKCSSDWANLTCFYAAGRLNNPWEHGQGCRHTKPPAITHYIDCSNFKLHFMNFINLSDLTNLTFHRCDRKRMLFALCSLSPIGEVWELYCMVCTDVAFSLMACLLFNLGSAELRPKCSIPQSQSNTSMSCNDGLMIVFGLVVRVTIPCLDVLSRQQRWKNQWIEMIFLENHQDAARGWSKGLLILEICMCEKHENVSFSVTL